MFLRWVLDDSAEDLLFVYKHFELRIRVKCWYAQNLNRQGFLFSFDMHNNILDPRFTRGGP